MPADPQAVQRFQMMEALIRRHAENADDAVLICRKCGRMDLDPDAGMELFTNWDAIASAARAHAAAKGTGHAVAVTFWQGQVFWPSKNKEKQSDG